MMAPFVDYNPTAFVSQHPYSIARADFCAPLDAVALVSQAGCTIVVAPRAFVASQADYFVYSFVTTPTSQTRGFHTHDFLVPSSYISSKSLRFAMVLAKLYAIH